MAQLTAYNREPIWYAEVKSSPLTFEEKDQRWHMTRTYLCRGVDLWDFLYNLIGDSWINTPPGKIPEDVPDSDSLDADEELYYIARITPHVFESVAADLGGQKIYLSCNSIENAAYVTPPTLAAQGWNALIPDSAATTTYCRVEASYQTTSYSVYGPNRDPVPITGTPTSVKEGSGKGSRFFTTLTIPQFSTVYSPISSYRYVTENAQANEAQGKPASAPQTATIREHTISEVWHMTPEVQPKTTLACLGAGNGKRGTQLLTDWSYSYFRHLTGKFIYDQHFKFRVVPRPASDVSHQLRFRPNLINTGIALPAEWAVATNLLNETVYDAVALGRLYYYTTPLY